MQAHTLWIHTGPHALSGCTYMFTQRCACTQQHACTVTPHTEHHEHTWAHAELGVSTHGQPQTGGRCGHREHRACTQTVGMPMAALLVHTHTHSMCTHTLHAHTLHVHTYIPFTYIHSMHIHTFHAHTHTHSMCTHTFHAHTHTPCATQTHSMCTRALLCKHRLTHNMCLHLCQCTQLL